MGLPSVVGLPDSSSTGPPESRVRPADPVGRNYMLHASRDSPDLRLCHGRVKRQGDYPLVQVQGSIAPVSPQGHSGKVRVKRDRDKMHARADPPAP